MKPRATLNQVLYARYQASVWNQGHSKICFHWHGSKSISIEFREMQIKTTMRYHLTQVRMAVFKKSTNRASPGGAVVKNLPANAGDAGSSPGQGTKIPHAMEQLSPCATTTEPEL